ncbi:flagellar biosynthesis protein FlhA [bacterium]|nr:flagellar biosynthesis protein FlhA [bacterium]
MFKNTKLQYIIKTVPADTTEPLENLLNEMSADGWELYSMHEVEADDGFNFNCIFVKDANITTNNAYDEVMNISAFKSQMEKMLSQKLTPYEITKDIQTKIKEQKKKVQKYKNQLENATAGSSERKTLNNKMSAGYKELENLQHSLVKAISPDEMFNYISSEKFSIHLNEEIVEFVSPEADNENDLLSETVKVRQQLTDELGYVIPKIIFKDDELLAPYEFSINIRELSVFNSFVYPNYLMYFQDELNIKKKKGMYTGIDSITGKKIIWISKEDTKDFWQKGITPSEYIGRALEYVSIKYVEELLDYEAVNKYMELVTEKNPFLVENIIGDFISVSELRYLMVSLIRERVSIKDIVYFFEKINDFSDEPTKEDLLDKIRLSMARIICNKYLSDEDTVQGIEFADKTMLNMFKAQQEDNEDNIVRLEASKIEKVVDKLEKTASELNLDNIILIVPMEVRHMIFMIFSQYINNLTVLAREEVTNYYNYETIAEI